MTKRTSFTILLLLVFLATPSYGQQSRGPKAEPFGFEIEAKTWFSTGRTDFNIAAPDRMPDPLSELVWDDLDSIIVEINADAAFYELIVISAGVGFGSIEDGSLIDRDWNDAGLIFSETRSDADDDDVLYFNVDAGARVFQWMDAASGEKGYVDVLIGYQRWKEKYVATNTIDLIPGTRAFTPDAAISEEFIWNNMRTGLKINLPLPWRLALKGRYFVVSLTGLEFEDVHHFRDDLSKDPSFEADVVGGVGFQFDTSLTFNPWKGLHLEVGYQLWDNFSGEGTITAHTAEGTETVEPFNEAESLRHGVILGAFYVW